MAQIFFDVTNIVRFAARYSRVTGIQRVQLNIIMLLSRKYGGGEVRCCFLDPQRASMLQFDPAQCSDSGEFDAETYLVELGLAQPASLLPSKVQIKGYLRAYNRSKVLRALKKLDVYFSAFLMPKRLLKLGIASRGGAVARRKVDVSQLNEIPVQSSYVLLGASWMERDIWQFAQAHRDRGGDVVQLVYDLIPLLHSQYLPSDESAAFGEWLHAALKYGTRFMAISEWTAKELTECGQARGASLRVHIVPLAHEFTGFARNQRIAAPPETLEWVGRRYVLCVGTIENRKNWESLLTVWRSLIAKLGDRTPQLVFAGKFGQGGAEFQTYVQAYPSLAARVSVLTAASDCALAWLYGNALCTVLPSYVEGWGLPVGESAWFGKLCIASRATSIPEVCGDLMEYVDPANIESIDAALQRAIEDVSYRDNKESAIRAAELRSWMDVADHIYAYVKAGAAA